MSGSITHRERGHGARAAGAKSAPVGATAAVVAGGALACGVCCVLPFALPAAALAMTGGVLAWFAQIQAEAAFAALAIVAGAWLWIGLRSLRTQRRPARSTLAAMTLATLMLAAALLWPRIEPAVFATLFG